MEGDALRLSLWLKRQPPISTSNDKAPWSCVSKMYIYCKLAIQFYSRSHGFILQDFPLKIVKVSFKLHNPFFPQYSPVFPQLLLSLVQRQ